MIDDYQKALEMCLVNIGYEPKVNETESKIEESIKMIKSLKSHGFFEDIDLQKLKKDLLTRYSTVVEPFQILEGKERREPWLKEYKSSHSQWDFWQRYSKYLLKHKGIDHNIILQIDELSDKVLDKLFNPHRTDDVILHKKGLVVGQVQSGKTANYIGLICKAADAGFNLIIVLAGIHNNLRSQTQSRIDEGFLGFDTQFERGINLHRTIKIGVGKIEGYENTIANSYTTSKEDGDFTRKSANTAGQNFNAQHPILLVVKKNASVLKRLYNWLRAQSSDNKITNKSLLIIDDEADNASINTNRKELDPTTINQSIRNILDLFCMSAYVGYTATPYANIFIPQNEKDLFPRDFIVNIPIPPNYIGPEKVFGTSKDPDETNNDIIPIITPIKDFECFVPPNHKKDDIKPSYSDIPQSLKTAVKCFIITCAIRIARGQGAMHNSMLIHTSRFQNWQNHIKELIEKLFNFYRQEIEAEDHAVYEEFRSILEVDTDNYKSYKTISTEILNSKNNHIDNKITVHTWDEIKANLYMAVHKIVVKSINGSSCDSLTYYENEKTGISVIVIGGDKLSRGLTLEGLSVSYFLRASKMYDTLMQMGRWFGYRQGYVDLCRLFTSEDLNEWFRHITIANVELLTEFEYLSEINGTPEDYELKVRNSPEQLQITSIQKMRYTEQIKVSWAGRLVETYQLSMDKGIKKRNLITTDQLLTTLGYGERINGNYLWKNVSPEVVINFFHEFLLPNSLKKVDLDMICAYIKGLICNNELTTWSVALMNKKIYPISTYTFSNGMVVNCFERTRADDTNFNTYYIRKNHIIGDQKDEFIDLDVNLVKEALDRTLNSERKKPWEKDYPSPKLVREEFRPCTCPLLLIYPLNPECANIKDKDNNIIAGTISYQKTDDPFIGFAISFPRSEVKDYAISYTINQIAEYAETESLFENENDNTYEDH